MENFEGKLVKCFFEKRGNSTKCTKEGSARGKWHRFGSSMAPTPTKVVTMGTVCHYPCMGGYDPPAKENKYTPPNGEENRISSGGASPSPTEIANVTNNGRIISSPTGLQQTEWHILTHVGTGGLAAARSRAGSDTALRCHSLPSRRFATSTVRETERNHTTKRQGRFFPIEQHKMRGTVHTKIRI